MAVLQEELIARCNIYGTVRTPQFLSQHVANTATNRCHPRHLGPEEPVVALAQAGDVYKLQYTVGGGGGHSINISNWTCDVFDAAVPLMESGSASWLVGYLGLVVGCWGCWWVARATGVLVYVWACRVAGSQLSGLVQ